MYIQRTPQRPPCYYSHPEVDKILDTLQLDWKTRVSIQYVLKVLVQKHHIRKKMQQDNRALPHTHFDGHCWIPAFLPETMLSSHLYTKRMDMLIEAGILKKRIKTSPKGRHSIYRLTHARWYRDYSLIPIDSLRITKKVARYAEQRSKKLVEIDECVVPHVIKSFSEIGITEDQFRRIWRHRYESKYRLEHTEHRLTVDQYMERGEVVWLLIKQWNHSGDVEKAQFFSTCNFGHRLHHPFTYMPKEVRPYILDRFSNPVQFTEFDMRCCQPTILANQLVAADPTFRDDLFVRLVEDGNLYRYVKNSLPTTEHLMKQETLHMIYCKPHYSTQRDFERLFARVAAETKRLKEFPHDEDGNVISAGKRHNLLPQSMQRAETRMFKPLWASLIKQGYRIIPVHDAIYVANIDSQQEREIKAEMEFHLKQHIRLRFEIKCKPAERIV